MGFSVGSPVEGEANAEVSEIKSASNLASTANDSD